MLKQALFLLLPLFAALCADCRKEPRIITETVVQTDTLFVVTHDTIVQQLTDTLTLTNFVQDTATTFLLVRHAETTGVGTNPPLSTVGQTRAAELVRVLKNVPLQAVYATNFARTMQTAQPSATDQGLPVQLYDPLAPHPLADNLLAAHPGETVLITGHSNTIPALLNILTGSTAFSNIPEAQYDNLYVVTVFEKGRAQVVHLKYGQ